MLNKEKIEKKKRMLRDFSEQGQGQRVFFEEDLELIRDILQKLEQKEAILDKITEFIKDDIKTNMENEETNTDGMKEYWRGCIDTEAEILEFIEGGKLKMGGFCNFFNCFCDDYEQIEKEQDETGEDCYIDCQDCEWYEE